MSSIVLFGICLVTWLTWVPAAIMQKRARGDEGRTSIFPVMPVFPLAGWFVGVGINSLKTNAGFVVIGGLHAVLLLVFAGSIVVSALRIRRNNGSRV